MNAANLHHVHELHEITFAQLQQRVPALHSKLAERI